MKIFKLMTIVLVVLFVFGIAHLSYAGDLKLEVSCPAKVAPGNPLDVSVQVINETTQAVFIRNVGTGIIGNPSDGNGLPFVYGPWNVPVNANILPGISGPFTIRITAAVDASLNGTIAGATVMAFDAKGWSVGGGGCAVAIEP